MGSGLLLAVIAAFLVMMLFSSRNAKKRQAEQRDKLAKEMVPGAWVMTTSGFYGRYVETDGDVIVLETSDGTETLWTTRAIVSVGNPPFAPDTESAGDSTTDHVGANGEDNQPTEDLKEDAKGDENPAGETEDSASEDSDSGEKNN
ncbi:preprotein translocase subunit YajC [Varibaculum vaginae]|uniref:preprotein translocase subunit YajC n=1 Tax=Varibaculum vaginae TaxID=2364797 RepID=UPI000F096847|nr:preprotein translocase subunit YajC [Varibaculum vaginae]